jgi:polyhydroxyalkanoate synthesis repressor PhaR
MAEMPESGPRRLEIRKYPNRRYYDTTRSRHVTLEEIYALIRDGYEVQITDSKSDQDITAKVLGQIIVELDPPKLGAFPVPLLHRLLRSNQALVNDFMQRYNQALATFLDSQRSVEQYLRSAMGMPSPTPTMADWTKLMFGPFNPALWSQAGRPPAGAGEPAPAPAGPQESAPSSPAEPPSAAPVPSAANQNSDVREVVNELRQEIAQLHEELGRMQKSRASRRAK